MGEIEDTVLAECSDDEEFNRLGIDFQNTWSPKLEAIEGLYQQFKKNKTMDLDWKCPGRRDPNQPEEPALEPESNQLSSSVKDMESDDFDFDEDAPPTTLKSAAKTGTIFKSKVSTKRTTTLAGILSNMERHRIMDNAPTGGDKIPTANDS